MSSRYADLSRPPLDERALRRALLDDRTWTSVDVLPEVGSTNVELRRRAGEGLAVAGAVLTTDHQPAGRGRRDRSWQTPPRASIAVSVLLAPTAPPARWSWLPLLAGVAVTDTLVRVAGLDARLKWPNDVLVPREGPRSPSGKVAGLLAEVVPLPGGTSGVVVGIGLNVSQRADELPVDTAVSLAGAGASSTDRDPLLRALLRDLATRYERWDDAAGDPRASGLAAAYRERCATLGLDVAVDLPGGDRLEGVAQEVDDDGRLVVAPALGGAPVPLAAGDVVHVRPS
ncbi:biotin--[acetyl-CoA-carboxylase] ligase [Angustibacter aerolatus]